MTLKSANLSQHPSNPMLSILHLINKYHNSHRALHKKIFVPSKAGGPKLWYSPPILSIQISNIIQNEI